MTKRNKIIYWIATVWLALGMVSTGIGQLVKMKAGQGGLDMMTHLGFPAYFLSIIGAWKMLGAAVILMPKFPQLKEWAYAGFFFLMTGAMYSHIAAGDAFTSVIPSLSLLVLTLLSWYFRPVERKMIPAVQTAGK